jgi:hypothetical protein
VDPSFALIPHIVITLVLLAVAGIGRRPVLLTALPLLDAALLVAYVFSEDTYRGHGISRWEAYRSPGGALGPMFVASLVLLVVIAALLAFAAARDRARLFRLAALGGGLGGVLLVFPTIFGFSAN